MNPFEQLVKERRSAIKFRPDIPISRDELDELFRMTASAPSAFNLQHTQYLAVTDPEQKEMLKNAAYGQHKIV